jgi:phosphoribosyl-ATP pyrophosphohydrolase
MSQDEIGTKQKVTNNNKKIKQKMMEEVEELVLLLEG